MIRRPTTKPAMKAVNIIWAYMAVVICILSVVLLSARCGMKSDIFTVPIYKKMWTTRWSSAEWVCAVRRVTIAQEENIFHRLSSITGADPQRMMQCTQSRRVPCSQILQKLCKIVRSCKTFARYCKTFARSPKTFARFCKNFERLLKILLIYCTEQNIIWFLKNLAIFVQDFC
jgi:hypothetical protein